MENTVTAEALLACKHFSMATKQNLIRCDSVEADEHLITISEAHTALFDVDVNVSGAYAIVKRENDSKLRYECQYL
jgi:hypothetical protein